MTTAEEANYINQVLPLMAQQPAGFDISEFGGKVGRPVTDAAEFFSLARRLTSERLAVPTNSGYTLYLAITTLGKQIAEGDRGYLGHLERQEEQRLVAERQAARSANGSWISGLAATVGILLGIYSLYAASQDTNQLKAQVEAQGQRIKALEAQLQHDKK